MLGTCIQHSLELQLAELTSVHNKRWQAVKEGICCLWQLYVAAPWQHWTFSSNC